ncbi:uncharacterized protein CEXT_98741 [Caerostris extrusa]|uniref:Uncharacterized protein n=1 Tax=Caerostris extrusa TaxID=172846 RepID=A0AAV4QB48_CAEEX|nr:uncharacterized protein CEXT_98741 [Caerostris extrusa]
MNPSRIEWLFAHDLMNFAMKDRDMFWVPATVVTFYRLTSPTVFTVDVGKVVRKLTISVKVRTKKKFKLIYESGLSTSLQFEMFMRNYALVHFTNEFSSRNFLPFCAFATDFAIRFYKHGAMEAPHHAIALVAEVLTDNKESFVKNGGWFSLQEECNDILESGCCCCCSSINILNCFGCFYKHR